MKPEVPETPGLMERIRNWRLPVRYRVPPTKDLIAYGLMALAFGLMVGLAIAPGWGNAGSTGPLIALPGQETPADTGTTDDGESSVTADLQPPVGDQQTTTTSSNVDTSGSTSLTSSTDTSVDTSTSTDIPTDDPGAEAPSNNYTEDPGTDNPGGPVDDGPDFTATVVGADDAGYAVADSSGNLLYVHYPNPVSTEPKVGKKVGIGITPVDNGTFLQSGTLESLGTAATSKLSGMVSWIDQDSGVITISSRGVSVAVNAASAMEKSASPPVLGSWITGTLSFAKTSSRSAGDSPYDLLAAHMLNRDGDTTDDPATEDPLTTPRLTLTSVEAAGDPLTQIEMSGPVSWDPATRSLTIAADGFGVLNREITIAVPKKLPLKKIQDALNYAASADLDGSGNLTLAGLSANYSLEAAADPAQAFGTHSR